MSKQHKAKPLKLVDTSADYDFQRVADVAREVQAETGPGKGAALANALERARLQTEIADLREENAELKDTVAELSFQIREMSQYNGPHCPRCATPTLIPVRTICQCAQCDVMVQVDEDVEIMGLRAGEPCPMCEFIVPDGELAIDDVTAQMLEYTKTEQAQRWARAWKAAAKVNRRFAKDLAKLIKEVVL